MEFIFGIAFGWVICRLVTGGAPTFDRLLVWDKDVFAWRIVPQGTKIVRGKRYLAATEVVPEEEKDEKF
tara:strand:- start:867 stop:1073 length:207 start_codon:yes stop_codon:yes gene_type:complete